MQEACQFTERLIELYYEQTAKAIINYAKTRCLILFDFMNGLSFHWKLGYAPKNLFPHFL